MLSFCFNQVRLHYVFMLLLPNTECEVTLTKRGRLVVVLFFHHKEVQHSELKRILWNALKLWKFMLPCPLLCCWSFCAYAGVEFLFPVGRRKASSQELAPRLACCTHVIVSSIPSAFSPAHSTLQKDYVCLQLSHFLLIVCLKMRHRCWQIPVLKHS